MNRPYDQLSLGRDAPEAQIASGRMPVEGIFVNARPLWDYFPKPFFQKSTTLLHGFEGRSAILGASYFLTHVESPMSSGRFPIYVCEKCGDFDCGTLSARINYEDETVIWSDFSYDANYEEFPFRQFSEVGPFHFFARDYNELFQSMLRDQLN